MRIARASIPVFVAITLVLGACKSANQASAAAAAPMKVIQAGPGQIIEYGGAAGAKSMAGAMASVLGQIHQVCGERPLVGQVFSVTGTNSNGVFFTVTDHAQNNRQLAGLVIAAQTGPGQFEVGVVSDTTTSFAQSANTMMQQLFNAWHPAGTGSAATGSAGSTTNGATPAGGAAASAPITGLHPITAPDNSASLSVPDGWQVDPSSGHGAIIVRGPNGEQMGLEMNRGGIDPTNAFRARSDARGQLEGPGTVVYAFRGDLTKEFVNVFQAWRKAGGQGPAKIQVDTINVMSEPQGVHGVTATGQIDPDGKGMQYFSDLLTVSDPTRDYGSYSVTLCHTMLPLAIADKEKPMLTSIINTYKPNMQVVNAENAKLIQQKQQSDQRIIANAQQIVNNIHAIGQQATARMNATEAANDAQHAGYWAQQNTNAQQSAGFSNYLLDQSVVQNNNVGGTGTVGHATVWNTQANAMVQANPNKYQIVNTPNYWQGVDY